MKRCSQEGPSKKGEYEYLAFTSHFSCEALCWLPDQMVNITYSLFTLVHYYLIFVEVQLIYNSSNKQTGTFGANTHAKHLLKPLHQGLVNISMNMIHLFTFFSAFLVIGRTDTKPVNH